jgi:subtilase family serine protease
MIRIVTAAAAVLLTAMLMAPEVGAAPSAAGTAQANERVCGVPVSGRASCMAIRHLGKSGKPGGPVPVSYGAAELQAAYGLTSAAQSNGAGSTVAIVDAYDNPNAYKDLAQYRTAEGLPAISSCAPPELATSSAPCFTKVNQSGAAGSYPEANTGWAQEISLDIDAVSATCPRCNLLLVEASSNRIADLGIAVATAASFGPVAIGNSYGTAEFSTEESLGQTYYAPPGIAVTASSGDGGYGVQFPAAASSVIAVGGTSLRLQSGAWTQTVWSGAGSGCSAYIAKPSWQHDTGCARRTVADVAAVADPNTGLRIYDTFNEPGWLVMGGTSASAQVVAGVYGLAGHGASNANGLYSGGSIPFGSPNPLLTDVTSGSNGSCTGGHGRLATPSLAYLCTGVTGYDGPTGMGTPRGTAGF